MIRALAAALCAFAAVPAQAAAPSLAAAQTLDLRLEAAEGPYLVRIRRSDLDRLAYAQALGETLPFIPEALAVREDAYPPLVHRGLPSEVARRAAGLWLLVRERGWTDSAGIEWDPRLGALSAASPDAPRDLRDAPASLPARRAGVWPASVSGSASVRDGGRSGVRCLEGGSFPSRCFRFWPPASGRRRS
ncbi:MAG: hypothetical protein HY554_01335 [Elusimicrobia bacterium]|nr:hypothetical protein [Elusimicrobiota bacterium]